MVIDVLSAVKGTGLGDVNGYNALTNFLREADGDTLCHYINALRNAMPYINKDHETLIGVVLSIDWTELDQTVTDVFIMFLVDLVSAKTYYLKVCIKNLIKQFLPKLQVFDDDLLKLNRKISNVHTALQAIVQLVPLSDQVVIDNITMFFPYIGKSLFILETYLVNILQVSTYAVGTRYHILSLVIDKLMAIDVRIPRHHLEPNVDEEEPLQFEVSTIDPVNDNSKLVAIENIARLDQLMMITLTYIDSFCHTQNSLDKNHAEQLFKDLLLIYDGVILKTQQSSHVQFILFYTASFHKRFCDEFTDCCWKIIENPNRASIIRRTSASYLSSFLARAKFVLKAVIKHQMLKLSEWIHRYLDFQNSANTTAEFDKHSPFYGVCQSLFYVFIYHHKSFMQSRVDIDFIKSLNFIRIVTSKLNPLKFCLSTIVNMFARITRIYEIVFCYSVIERNNRNVLSEFTFTNNVKQSSYMESFFPFDPYMLSKSARYIEPIYLEWSGALDDSDSENSTEEISDTADTFVSSNTRHGSHSFDMVCVSPGFNLLQHEI